MTKKQSNTNKAAKTAPSTDPASKTGNPSAEKQTKAAAIIKLLRRPEGATLEQMMAATGWQKHSIRGFMAGTLKKKHDLTVVSMKLDGSRTYRVEAAEIQA